jgi:hypothetical protein
MEVTIKPSTAAAGTRTFNPATLAVAIVWKTSSF